MSESALKGYRTLAVARGPETGSPGLIGLVTLYDPPRPDARQLISALHDLGVSLGMLGDTAEGRRFVANTPEDRDVLESFAAVDELGREGALRHEEGRNLFDPS